MRAITTLLLLAFAAPVQAQSDCADGTIHDDGSFENGVGSSSVFSTHVVMRLDPPAGRTLPPRRVVRSPTPRRHTGGRRISDSL